MLEMIRGCSVKKFEQLYEQYEIEENGITANVNTSKIERLFKEFISMQSERLFFILEVPLSEQKERELRKVNTDPFHNEVYYIDGLSKENALMLLDKYGELLINDGLTEFGFGVHDNSAEIMCYKYNEIKLWAKEIKNFVQLFSKMNIPISEHCKTAMETFDENNPGDSWAITINGMSVFDLIDILKDWGLYLAEIR